MSDRTPSCPGDDVLVGLAVGELDGRERADALAHLARCPTCRDEVQELTDVAEQVLLAAPIADPPERFEADVLDRLQRQASSAHRRLARVLIAAAAAVVLVAAFAGMLAVSDDAPALAEARMVTPSGRDVGAAWRYGDDPPWVFVSVPGWRRWEDPNGPPGRYVLQAQLDDGTTTVLGEIAFGDATEGSWGTTTPVAAERIHSVAITDDSGRVWCMAEF